MHDPMVDEPRLVVRIEPNQQDPRRLVVEGSRGVVASGAIHGYLLSFMGRIEQQGTWRITAELVDPDPQESP